MSIELPNLESILTERDQILMDLDQDAAKAFVIKHGGKAPSTIDWEIVLHLARWEVETIPAEEKQETRIFLARSGKYGIASLPQNSVYARVTLDLIFPKDIISDAYISEFVKGGKPMMRISDERARTIAEAAITFEAAKDDALDTSGHRWVDLGDGVSARLNMSPDASPKAVEAVTELMRLAKQKLQEDDPQ